MPKIFFLFFQEYFSFRNSTFACDEYFAVRTQIRGQTLQAVKQSLTWMPKTFDARFPVSVNSLWWAMCSHLSSALSKFKCLAAKHLCLNPLWYYFLVTCPRLDPDDGITGRRCAWMSLEETVVVLIQYVVGCLYTDIAKTSIGNFRQVRTAFSGELPQARTILLFGSYSGTFLHVEIFWLVDESNTKFACHIACCAWSAVKWSTRRV